MSAQKKNKIMKLAASIAALALALALASLAGCSSAAAPDALAGGQSEPTSGVGSAFPAFSAAPIEGGDTVDNSLFERSKLTAVCLWTAECPYCPAQLELLEQLAKEYGSQGFAAVGLLIGAADSPDALAGARIALSQGGAGLPQLIAGGSITPRALSSESRVPLTVFVDGEGRIASEAFVGERDKDEMEETIVRLLAA